MRRSSLLLAASAALLAALTGCGRSGSTPSSSLPLTPSTPNIKAFLALPVATPSVCPSNANGTTVGRTSPWVGTVDVSVFLKLRASTRDRLVLARSLSSSPIVTRVYFESRAEAYQEFERLYTCSASVSPSQTPASYRVILATSVTLTQRNALVKRVAQLPGVDSVSCDPAIPCVNVIRSLAQAKASRSSSPDVAPAAPQTRITSMRIHRLAARATFRFTARGATAYQCALRRGNARAHYVACHSPASYDALRGGQYTFSVRAIGPGGPDPTPARRSFTL